MPLHDLGVAAAVALGIFLIGYIFNRGKIEGRGFEIASVIALALIFWAFAARNNYFGITHYTFH